MKKLLEENETLTQIVNDTGRPHGFHQSISRTFSSKIRLKIKSFSQTKSIPSLLYAYKSLIINNRYNGYKQYHLYLTLLIPTSDFFFFFTHTILHTKCVNKLGVHRTNKYSMRE